MIKTISIEKIFLFISLIFGFLYIFILPPFQSVDEPAHFYRSYEIIINKLFPKKINNEVGDYLPSSLKKLVSKYSPLIKNIDKKINTQYIISSDSIKLAPRKVEFISFQNTALYSPTCYLTQIPGMYIAKKLGATPLTIFYFGRISNLLFFILIIYFSIRIIPFYKLTTMLIALMPMTLSLAGSLTSDVVVIGLNILWIAILLKILVKNEKINNWEILILILLSLILALSKDYFMLIPLIFILPKSKFKNWSEYFICISGVVLVALIGAIFWQNIIDELTFNMNASANAAAQLNFILSNPIFYLKVVLKTLFIKTPQLIITMIGILGCQDTLLDFLTYMLYPVLFFLSILTEPQTEFKFKKWQVNIIAFDIIISVFLIFTSLYLMWSALASPVIYGLKGKYFIPLVLPFFLLFYNCRKTFESENIKLFICVMLVLILVSSDLSLIHRFYNMVPYFHHRI